MRSIAMNRDYKTFPSSSVFGRRSSSTLLVGIFIGYALGLLTAIGTWMYINQAPSPFISQEKSSVEEGQSPMSLSRSDQAAQGAGGNPASDGNRPRFEFYQMLPGTDEPAVEQQSGQAAQRPPSQQEQSILPQASSEQSFPQQPSSTERYFLQAGSFQNENDAENLKAKLAMLGIQASIQAADVPAKGVWHRVRLGPYASTGDMDRIRASLQRSGIQSSPVKIGHGVQ